MTDQSNYWQGRTAIVTGATRGIGRATALLLAGCGAHVMVHGRDEAQAHEVAGRIRSSGGNVSVVLGDLRESDTSDQLIEETMRKTGRIDLLVNNAGANVFRGTTNATLEDWNDCLNLDLRSVWLNSKAAAAVMTSGSSIVNISSNHATSTLADVFPYNVAKAGVNALTQSLAIELAPRGIRANVVAPGYIDTAISDAYFASFPDAQRARAQAEGLHPVNRFGTADEVAHAIRFLGDGSQSGFTTGIVFTLDGGRSTLMQDPVQVEQATQ